MRQKAQGPVQGLPFACGAGLCCPRAPSTTKKTTHIAPPGGLPLLLPAAVPTNTDPSLHCF